CLVRKPLSHQISWRTYKSGVSGRDSIVHTRSFTRIFSSFGIVLASGPPASHSSYTCFAGLLYGHWPVPPRPLSFDYGEFYIDVLISLDVGQAFAELVDIRSHRHGKLGFELKQRRAAHRSVIRLRFHKIGRAHV